MKKTLISILAALSLAQGAKAAIIDVPVYEAGTDIQSYYNQASPGDTLNFIPGNTTVITPLTSVYADKGITWQGNGMTVSYVQGGDFITVAGSLTETINGFSISMGNAGTAIKMTEQSSLIVQNSSMGNIIYGIIKDSSGNLTFTQNNSMGTEGLTQNSIVLNNLEGIINIDRNFFAWEQSAIKVGSQTFAVSMAKASNLSLAKADIVTPQLNIVNNTMAYQFQDGILVDGVLTIDGYIANNNMAYMPNFIDDTSKIPNVEVTNNNLFNPAQLSLAQKGRLQSLATTSGNNFSINPDFENQGYSPVITETSPLRNAQGAYIPGVTTYIQDPSLAYIGSFEYVPQTIPEPSTTMLVGIGLVTLLASQRLRQKK